MESVVRNTIILAIALFLLIIMTGCSDERIDTIFISSLACTEDAQCVCSDGEAACTDEVCQCKVTETETEIVEVERIVEIDVVCEDPTTDCDCNAAGGDASCTTAGTCQCTETEVVEVERECTEDIECLCIEGTPACVEKACTCTITETITITEIITEVVTVNSNSCAERPCADVEGLNAICNVDNECRYERLPPDTLECRPITRIELVKSLAQELEGFDSFIPPAGPTFPDVLPEDLGFKAVEFLVEQGIVDGNGNGFFQPEHPVSRAEVVRMVIKSIDGLSGYEPPPTPTFDDVQPEDWYYNYVEASVQLGLVYGLFDRAGNLNGRFGPGDSASDCLLRQLMDGIERGSCQVDGECDCGSATATPSCTDRQCYCFQDIPRDIPRIIFTRADQPTSQTLVKGEQGSHGVSVFVSTPNLADLTELKFMIYSTVTTVQLENIIESAWLYVDGVLVDGSFLSNVQVLSGSTRGDIEFSNFLAGLPALSTNEITLKLDLSSTLDVQVSFVAALVPCNESGFSNIAAEDQDANWLAANPVDMTDHVNPSCATINGPVTTVKLKGGSSATVEGSPDGGIVMAGSDNVFTTRYRLEATDEDRHTRRLTIINDLDGAFDSPTDTSALRMVGIRYKNGAGVDREALSFMVNGQMTLVNLDIFVREGEDYFVEIFAEVNTMGMVGPELSGAQFRLGILEDNTVATFESVGLSSSEADYNIPISGSENVQTFTVKKCRPYFSRLGNPTRLSNGTHTLYEQQVVVGQGCSVGFARMAWFVNFADANGGGELQLSDVRIVRNASQLTDVNIELVPSSNNGMWIIASFQQEEVVSYDPSGTIYSLQAQINGVETGDVIVTSLPGDPNPSSPNTMQLVNFDPTLGLFLSLSELQTELPPDRFIIWSDQSAEPHIFSTADGGSSADWSNGYQTGLEFLSPNVLSVN